MFTQFLSGLAFGGGFFFMGFAALIAFGFITKPNKRHWEQSQKNNEESIAALQERNSISRMMLHHIERIAESSERN
jgi:hypothetical protein